MIITILGSCRQQPLSKYFKTTNIQNGVTFPHYTKEILQAAEFCKGVLSMPLDVTQKVFRLGLLTKNTINSSDFINDFNNTDIFVVEITSRQSYEYEGYYAHWIAYEENEAYGYCNIPDKEKIIKSELSDQEIENDIIKLKNVLSPKKLLIVPHIYTRKEGKRYDLVKLVESICQKYDLPFLDVSVELEKKQHISDVYCKEQKLAHFTDYGYHLVADIYRDKINSML